MRSLNAEGQRFLKEFSLIFLKKKQNLACSQKLSQVGTSFLGFRV